MGAFRNLKMRQVWKKIPSLLDSSSFDKTTEDGRSQERYRRIFATTVASVASKSVSIITNLISVPLTVNYLGTERYGLWMTISSAIALLSFADLGMGNGLVNVIAEADGKDDRQSPQVYVSSTFIILLGIAILILMAFASIYSIVPWERVFNVKSDLAIRESGPTMAVLIATFALNIPLGVAQRVQMGYQEGYKSQLWTIAGGLLGLGGLLLAIYLKVGLPWLVLAISGGPLLAMLGNWIFLFSFSHNWLLPKLRTFNWDAGKKIVTLGTSFLILQILVLLGTTSDNFIISQVLGASSVASYAIAQKMFSAAFISQSLLAPLWSAFGEAVSRGDRAWARKTLNRSVIFNTIVGISIASILVIFGKQLITHWTNSTLVPSTSVLVGFALWLVMVSSGGSITVFLNGVSLLKQQIILTGIASIASLFLKIMLVYNFQVGGVIWASVIGYGVFYLIPAFKLAYSRV